MPYYMIKGKISNDHSIFKGEVTMKKLICANIIVITVIIGLFSYKTIGEILLRLYPGDRVKAEIIVECNDSIYHLENASFELKGSGKVNVTSAHKAKIRFRANSKESYTVKISNTPLNQPIRLKFFQHMCWNVQRAKITVHIDTVSKEVTARGYSFSGDDGIQKINRTFTYNDEPVEGSELEFYFS